MAPLAVSAQPLDPGPPTSRDRYRFLRELGSPATPTYAAEERLPDGKKQLVVFERIVRAGRDAEAMEELGQDARRIAEVDHPNIARARDVIAHADDLLVRNDFIDGETLAEVASTPSPQQNLDVWLRVLLDALNGLNVLHNLRDPKRGALKLIHGELTPRNIVVGLDGASRLIHVCRARSETPAMERDGYQYLAPEVLLVKPFDPRADLYSVGVLLWEALSGKSLFVGAPASAIVGMVASGSVPRATPPASAAWAAPLVGVAARALSGEPDKRFASAAVMAAEIRRIAGTHVASATRVANFVKATFGERVRDRRAKLESTDERSAAELEQRLNAETVRDSWERLSLRDPAVAFVQLPPAPIPSKPPPVPSRPPPAVPPPADDDEEMVLSLRDPSAEVSLAPPKPLTKPPPVPSRAPPADTVPVFAAPAPLPFAVPPSAPAETSTAVQALEVVEASPSPEEGAVDVAVVDARDELPTTVRRPRPPRSRAKLAALLAGAGLGGTIAGVLWLAGRGATTTEAAPSGASRETTPAMTSTAPERPTAPDLPATTSTPTAAPTPIAISTSTASAPTSSASTPAASTNPATRPPPPITAPPPASTSPAASPSGPKPRFEPSGI